MPFGDHSSFNFRVGWRDAPEAAYYGLGIDTSQDARANYRWQQTVAEGLVELRPRKWIVLDGAVAYEDYTIEPGLGSAPSIETIYNPVTAPGLGSSPTYLHSHGTLGIDWRPFRYYARSGGFYGVTFHNYADSDDALSFDKLDANLIQHIPIFRDTWVLSFHGRVETTLDDDDVVPFFLLPSLGSGRTLRAYSSWRFRDRHSLLGQAEFRWIPNRLGMDWALFYDIGKVASQTGRSRLRRGEEQLRHRSTVSPPGGHLPQDRRRPRLRGLETRLRFRCGVLSHAQIDLRSRRPHCHSGGGLLDRSRRLAAVLQGRSDCPRAGDAGRIEGCGVGNRSRRRPAPQPVRASRRSDAERACKEHQHGRRGAGLELVHEPHLRETGLDRGAAARSEHDRRSRRRGNGRSSVPRRPAPPPASSSGTRKERRGSSRSTARTTRARRPPPSRSPAGSSGRSATTRSRATSAALTPRTSPSRTTHASEPCRVASGR